MLFAAGYFTQQFVGTPMQMDHSAMNMDMSMEERGDKGPASQAYRAANAKMHDGMNIEFSGNSDIDFAKGMIAHHEGAVAMAEIQIQYGSNPEMLALAKGIIAAQIPEIAQMNEWLSKNAK
ncbi:MAG: DUF305 domain-containing protein [Ahrensia sp.]|nr:DUF305 domain-containing protein [Ahrensia sp.]